MKKVLSLVLVLALAVSCLSMITVFAADSVLDKNLLTDAQSTFTGQTDVPAGWGALGSTISIAEDPLNPNNKVLKGTTSGTYQTPMIDVGQLLKDTFVANNLEAAYVKFSLNVYVEGDGTSENGGVARLIFRNTEKASFVNDKNNKLTSMAAAGNAFNAWHTIESYLYITKADLDTVDTGNNKWSLCVDSIKGSSNLYFDDVVVAVTEMAGIKITLSAENGFVASASSKGFLAGEKVQDGKVNIKMLLSNESAADFYAQLQPGILHVDGGKESWKYPNTGEWQLVPAGKSVELTLAVPEKYTVENADGTTVDYTYLQYFPKINLAVDAQNSKGIPAGSEFYISGYDMNFYSASNTAKAVIVKTLPESAKNPWTPEQTVPTVKVVNGNAEDGTKGWGVFSQGAGEVAQVEGGANGTAHAIKFTPSGAKQQYESIAFDLGPAIIDDQANGYNGAGVGEYTLKFWAKGEKAGKFEVLLNSQAHFGDVKKEPLSTIGAKVSSFLNTGVIIELTTEWKQYEVTLKVTQDFMDVIKGLYANYPAAYQLILRLDGSDTGKGKAFAESTFAYFVDEVELAVPQNQPEEPAKVQGVTAKVTKVEADKEGNVEAYVNLKGLTGHLSGGKMKIRVHNTGTKALTFVLEARLEDEVWTTIGKSEEVTIAPGKVAEISLDCPAKKASPKDNKEYVPFGLLAMKDVAVGNSFTMYGFDTSAMESYKGALTVVKGAVDVNFATTTTPCPTGDAAPAMMITAVAVACTMLGLVVVAKKKKENA